MTKKHTNLNIDSDILEQAKENKLNMSEIAEGAIKSKLGVVEIKPKGAKCRYCGESFDFANADDPDKGLMFLWPDEHWICQACFRDKTKQVTRTTY